MSNNLNKDADPNDVISLEALKKILLSSRSLKIEDADGNVAAFKVPKELIDRLLVDPIAQVEGKKSQDTVDGATKPLSPQII